jgi:DtxR family Mn-dependent transcriptional regulator
LDKTLSSQMEDYLEIIYQLCRENGLARVKDIADRLAVSNPSVVGAIKNLKSRKLVVQEPYGYIRLTARGSRLAAAVVQKHEVLRDFLEKILALDPETAARDACKMEHAISAKTLERFTDLMEFIAEAPKGLNTWLDHFNQTGA